MKKILNLLILLVALQSCTQEEIKPDSPVSETSFNISDMASDMHLSATDIKALLLRPVDNNPATNLTTLYYADARGNILPVIENFEVKEAQVSSRGMYVLTNYASIAFFVKFDRTWVELKDVGDYKGVNDEGNIVFSNGAILNTETLAVDRSHLLPAGSYVAKSSGNLSLIINGEFNGRRIRNNVTNVEVLPMVNSSNYPIFESLHDNNMAVLSFNAEELVVIDMNTGEQTWIEKEFFFKPIALVPNLTDNGIIGIGEFYFPKSGPEDYGNALTSVNFRYANGESGEILVDRGSQERNYEGLTLTNTGTRILYNRTGLESLNLSMVSAYTYKGDLIYYSGTQNGQSVAGIYNLATNQNMVAPTEHLFTNIQPF